MLQCWENAAKSCQKPGLCQLLAFCLLTHSIQGTLCWCRWGLREEVTVPSSWGKEKASPPPSTSCNAPCTKVIYHYRLDRSSVHSTALCHASLIDTMPKMTSFNSSLVNRRVCNSEAELRFLFVLNLFFCSEGKCLMLPLIPLLCFFLTSVVIFVKIKGKFKLTSFSRP